MKHPSHLTLRLWVLLFLPILPGALRAEQVNLELRIRPGAEAVSFPLQHAPLLQGRVASVPSSLSLQITPSGDALAGSSPLYVTVTGPAGHPLEGERMELDEVASRAAGNGQLVIEPSPLNTLPEVDSRWIDAECEVVPHWTLQDTLGELIRRRLSSPWPGGTPTLWLPWGFGVLQKITPRLTVSSPPRLVWTFDRDKLWPAEKTIVPPGQAFLIKSSHPFGFGFSLGGERRLTPCRVPLGAGPNLVGYPFPADLRLGVDWGRAADGLVASPSPTLCDRLQMYSGEDLTMFGFHSSGRWYRILGYGTSSVRWDLSSAPLDIIPVGYGFVLFKLKPDPGHVFRPPQP